MAKIYLDHITKIFDERILAVDDLTLEAPDKSITGLLGPSGCGKTTTMRIISGLEEPTKGKVYIDNLDVTDLPPEKRDVAMVFQFPVVYSTMDVFDNIAFPLQARKVPRDEVKQRVKEVADLLGVTHVLYERPERLDVGIKQKVALARCFIRRPKVYLLDEPLTVLDPSTRVELRGKLKEMQKLFGQTMIYVTHDQSEALTIADKVGMMKKGKLLQYDTPENIYKRPANTFVAWFIGNPGMSFIDCSFKVIDGKACLDAGVFEYDVNYVAETLKEQASGPELVLGIRPEYVEVSLKKKKDWIPMKCVFVESWGNRVVLHLQAGDHLIRAKMPPVLDICEGDDVWIYLPLEHVRIFDRKTQVLIV